MCESAEDCRCQVKRYKCLNGEYCGHHGHQISENFLPMSIEEVKASERTREIFEKCSEIVKKQVVDMGDRGKSLQFLYLLER